MNERIQEQYELWTQSELYPVVCEAERHLHDLLGDDTTLTDMANAAAVEIQEAAFAGGFAWAVALHDAAIEAAQVTAPRLLHITETLKNRRDALLAEAERTQNSAHFDRCSAAAEAYGHAYRMIVPMEKEPNPHG